MDYKDVITEIDSYLYAIHVSGDDVLRMAHARQLLKVLIEQLRSDVDKQA